MSTSGRVIGLQILVEHRGQPEPVRRAKALVDLGLEGDVHGKKKAGSRRQVLIVDRATLKKAGSRRQVLIVDRATLEALGLRPGDLREQITVEFPALETLPSGTLLCVGGVTCELTGP